MGTTAPFCSLIVDEQLILFCQRSRTFYYILYTMIYYVFLVSDLTHRIPKKNDTVCSIRMLVQDLNKTHRKKSTGFVSIVAMSAVSGLVAFSWTIECGQCKEFIMLFSYCSAAGL